MLDGDIYGMIAPYATANFWVSRLEAECPRVAHG